MPGHLPRSPMQRIEVAARRVLRSLSTKARFDTPGASTSMEWLGPQRGNAWAADCAEKLLDRLPRLLCRFGRHALQRYLPVFPLIFGNSE